MTKSARSTPVVDVIGHYSGGLGWTTHSVGFARALNQLTTVNFRTRRKQALKGLLSRDGPMLYRGLRRPRGDFSVVIAGDSPGMERSSRWIVWETTRLPDWQLEMCQSVACLWTPSSWGRTNLLANAIEPHRVAVVPEGVDSDFYVPQPHRQSGGRFRFLMVGKWEVRKFADGLLKAFTAEFAAHENVELYLQAHNAYIPGFSLATAVQRTGVSNSANILLGQPCSLPQLRSLYQSADCFVLPTRAEGWGLPILESMACGIPAIVTRYSAPMDFVNDDNGYLLDYKGLVEARDPDFSIHTGEWAEPDIEHLRYLMRRAFTQKEERNHKGILARQTAERFSWKNSAEVALAAIESHPGGALLPGAYASPVAHPAPEPLPPE